MSAKRHRWTPWLVGVDIQRCDWCGTKRRHVPTRYELADGTRLSLLPRCSTDRVEAIRLTPAQSYALHLIGRDLLPLLESLGLVSTDGERKRLTPDGRRWLEIHHAR